MRRARPKRVKALVKSALGPLEERVMQVVCGRGRCTVRDVIRAMAADHFAYTTVMTTMDRLYRKGLLRRETGNKAYVYSSPYSLQDLDLLRARDLFTALLECEQAPPKILAEALVEAAYKFSPSLPEEILYQIRVREQAAIAHEVSALRVSRQDRLAVAGRSLPS